MTLSGDLRIVDSSTASASLLASLQKAWSDESAWMEESWDDAAWRTILAMPGCFALLAARADVPVGFAAARAVADEAELLLIAVAPMARRIGVGAALLAAVAARSRARGAVRLLLEVAESNRPALALYGTAGFVSVGRRNDYYELVNCRAAALVMARRLSD